MPIVRINERSWGIDLISCINEFIAGKDFVIKRAGGENSLKSSHNTMFPDVLLFGDSQSAKILLGWELKMPDTDINNDEFISNAFTKAKLLKLNSFLLWNVNYAKLYVIEDDKLKIEKEWELSQILGTREDVQNNRSLWIELLKNIIIDLNEFIINGTVCTTKISESLTSDDIINFIFKNKYLLVDKYSTCVAENAQFQDEINLWWKTIEHEYPQNSNKLEILAEINILSWINKFIFANLLKRYFNQARVIENIVKEINTNEALQIIEEISHNCDFYNVFKKQMANNIMPDLIWRDLKNLNAFLIDSHLQDIDFADWHEIFERLISIKHRKLYGQYTTPVNLARLLVNLTIENKNLRILDPCCGTGTIAKEALKLKQEYGVDKNSIQNKIWASDKIAFPLQLATISLFDPNEKSEIINVFQDDVANLSIGKDILFFDPNNGNEVYKSLPVFDYIVSNLPFVKGQDIPEYNETIRLINNFIGNNIGNDYKLDQRADLAYYIPFKLWSLLNENGKLGIIISNSWLGTESGERFRKSLRKMFYIENIITSGNGKWFDNAKIVTNILILKKKSNQEIRLDNTNDKICFTTLKQNINELDINDNISYIRNNNSRDNNVVKKVIYTKDTIDKLENIGLQWSALFTNMNWLQDIESKLTNITEYFNVKRGIKSGLDSFFYTDLSPKNEYEDLYAPILMNSKNIKRLLHNQADKYALCTDYSLEYLRENYNNIYSKIISTSPSHDGKTPPNVSLLPAKEKWYQLKSITADIVTCINPDKRLFFAKVPRNLLINQRLVLMDYKENYNPITKKLLHALLNSLLGQFYIEALSFGRGDGAADLNATKIAKKFKILNPKLLKKVDYNKIIKSFDSLLNRDIQILEKELYSNDRITFDKIILSAFNILEYEDQIRESLLYLHKLRETSKQ